MSAENVEVVRSYVEAFGSPDLAPSDWSGLAADRYEPYADYYPVRKFPEARPCHGDDEIARFLAEYRDAWDRYEMEVQKLIPLAMIASSFTLYSGPRDARAV